MAKEKENFEAKLSGLSVMECPLECEPTHCVITQDGICGHPCKSGLHSKHKNDADTMARYRASRKVVQAELDAKKAAQEALANG